MRVVVYAFQIRLEALWRAIGDRHFIKQMLWVGPIWVLTMLIIYLNIQFLNARYPDPVRPDDLLLDLIPETEAFIFIGDLATTGLFAVTILYFGFWQQAMHRLPKLLFLLAVMYTIRAFVINLTPLAQIQAPADNFHESHFIAQTFYHGMYFSGHTASAFMQAFFFRGYAHRWVLFVLAGTAAFSLIASHSHYTIDIVGGFFVAYFVVNFEWMRLVPRRWHEAEWAPWHDVRQAQAERAAPMPEAVASINEAPPR